MLSDGPGKTHRTLASLISLCELQTSQSGEKRCTDSPKNPECVHWSLLASYRAIQRTQVIKGRTNVRLLQAEAAGRPLVWGRGDSLADPIAAAAVWVGRGAPELPDLGDAGRTSGEDGKERQ